MNVRTTIRLVVIATLAFVARRAQAVDNVGAPGAVVGVEISESGSDEYTVARGRLFLNEGDTVQVYPWQGTACNGRPINDQQIDILVESMNKKNTRIIPYWRVGAGGVRCLVAFTITPSAKLLPLVARP